MFRKVSHTFHKFIDFGSHTRCMTLPTLWIVVFRGLEASFSGRWFFIFFLQPNHSTGESRTSTRDFRSQGDCEPHSRHELASLGRRNVHTEQAEKQKKSCLKLRNHHRLFGRVIISSYTEGALLWATAGWEKRSRKLNYIRLHEKSCRRFSLFSANVKHLSGAEVLIISWNEEKKPSNNHFAFLHQITHRSRRSDNDDIQWLLSRHMDGTPYTSSKTHFSNERQVGCRVVWELEVHKNWRPHEMQCQLKVVLESPNTL